MRDEAKRHEMKINERNKTRGNETKRAATSGSETQADEMKIHERYGTRSNKRKRNETQ